MVGWTLHGNLDGTPVSTMIAAQPGPQDLVHADAIGNLVVVKSADSDDFTPLFVYGEPFAWSTATWAHAQAVLSARGSRSRLMAQ